MTTLLEAAKAVAKAWREFVTDPHVPPLLAELERSVAAAESAPAVMVLDGDRIATLWSRAILRAVEEQRPEPLVFAEMVLMEFRADTDREP